MRREDRLPLFLLGVDLLALVVSGIGPKDPLTWWMEVAPFLIALPVLLATYRRFRFTDVVYVLIAIHACVLFLGGHYTYAEVPLGFWAQRVLGLVRNDYDRVGHFFQGFVPALVTREVLLRRTPLRPGGWLTVLVVSVCLAVSALYELVEWGAAVMLHQGADAFLGTQGDPWDTQEDMATCLVGAIVAVVLLSRWHDRQLAALGANGGAGARRSRLLGADRGSPRGRPVSCSRSASGGSGSVRWRPRRSGRRVPSPNMQPTSIFPARRPDRRAAVLLMASLLGCAAGSTRPTPAQGARALPLEAPEGLTLVHARAEAVTHDGRRGLRLHALDEVGPDDVVLAIVQGVELGDGENLGRGLGRAAGGRSRRDARLHRRVVSRLGRWLLLRGHVPAAQ